MLITKSVKLLIQLNIMDDEIATVLMALYSEGFPELQDLIMGFFQSKGLEDPHNYFARELDSSISSGTSLTEMMVKSTDWMDSWRKDYYQDNKQLLGVRGGGGKGKAGIHRKQSLPSSCDPIEVINYFVRLEHEKALARYEREREQGEREREREGVGKETERERERQRWCVFETEKRRERERERGMNES